MAQRAAIYFPVDTIMSNFTRAVSRAELHLFADTTSLLEIPLTGANMFVNHGFLNDSTWLTHPDSLQLNRLLGLEAGQQGYGVWDRTSSEVSFDVTGAVASWVSRSSVNGGLQVFSGDEFSTLSRVVFYGADADSVNKRPTLLIWYTEISH
jgi:hypothetical protein